MAVTTATSRRDRRFSVSLAEGVRVEFLHPKPGGRPYALPLLDLSVAGLSFVYGDDLNGLEPGLKITEAVVHVGNCKIEGDLLVLHSRAEHDGRNIAGALFYPGQDQDLMKLMSVIAGIEAVQID